MGLWSGHSTSIQEPINSSIAEQEMAIAHKIARREEMKLKAAQDIRQVARSVAGPEARFGLGKSVGQAVLAGQQQEVSFSREQQMLGQMFGQGEKIWGTNNQPVTINHDLNPSRSDPWDETGSLFGFGGHSERSGLF